MGFCVTTTLPLTLGSRLKFAAPIARLKIFLLKYRAPSAKLLRGILPLSEDNFHLCAVSNKVLSYET